MSFDPETIPALALLRKFTGPDGGRTPQGAVVQALRVLDRAGVFAVLDEQADTERAEAALAEAVAQEQLKHHPGVAPEEALQVLHNTWQREHRNGRRDPLASVSRPGKLERVPGTDTLRPAHEHAFQSPHSGEVCYAAEGCEMTYGEHRLSRQAVEDNQSMRRDRGLL